MPLGTDLRSSQRLQSPGRRELGWIRRIILVAAQVHGIVSHSLTLKNNLVMFETIEAYDCDNVELSPAMKLAI